MTLLGMQTYVKKPIEIEAVQFDYGEVFTREEALFWHEFGSVLFAWDSERPWDGWIELKIKTLEGTMIANKGDWIIRGIEGEIYPCKDSVFQATYEFKP